MTRATWDDDGTKYFETGIDRGMLYIPFIPGMVWNGLVKVTETPTGTAPREFYIDGQKYLNLPSLEEYAATIEAFSAPKEFAAATGMAELSPGMYVTDQTRQAFGFSYRTLIGSDGSDLGADYKIHIVYNAMAKTSDFTAKTTSGSADSPTQTWSLTTIAPQDSTPFRPTSHFIIDTRKIDQDIVAHIEDVLYGTDTTDPRLPTVSELLAILSEVVATVAMTTKKMVVAIFGSAGASELSIATMAMRTKKMRIAVSGSGRSSATMAMRTKKMRIDIEGSTVSSPVPQGAPDLLPYLITDGAVGTGGTTLTMNVTDDGGWPALPGDNIIVCGGSGGAQPISVTDRLGNGYAKLAGTNTTPASSVWVGAANLGSGGGLQTAAGPRGVLDTISVNYSGTAQAKQWIAFGCRNLGATDLLATPTSGNSAAPSISSGTPVVPNELVVVTVVHANAGGTINTPAGWRLIKKNVTSGSNALASVFVKQNRTSTGVTFTAALTSATTWTCQLVTFRPALTDLRGIVGGSVFTPAYPGELSPNDNWHAQLRFRSVTARNTNSIKRYCPEVGPSGSTGAGPGNDVESIVGVWGANGLKQVVSVKPMRAVGGGNSTGDTWLRNSIIYWRNYGLDLDLIVGNEANINGIHGPMGDGTKKDWDLNSPYTGVITPDQAGQNYKDYFLRAARIIVSAGYSAWFNPAISTQNFDIFVPDRLDTDGHPLLCGVSIDYYFAGDFSSNGITMRPVIAACDAMNPPCPVGIGELGVTDGKDRPLLDTPAGSLADAVSWFDAEVTGQFAPRPANNHRNGPLIWFAAGTANSLDTTTPISIIKAFRRFFDACSR